MRRKIQIKRVRCSTESLQILLPETMKNWKAVHVDKDAIGSLRINTVSDRNKHWLQDLAERVVNIEGVYSFDSNSSKEIQLRLILGYEWTTPITNGLAGTRIDFAVKQLLVRHLKRGGFAIGRAVRSYELSDFASVTHHNRTPVYR